MHEAEFISHELTAYADAIRQVSRPCLAGVPCQRESNSYFGGMPHVPPGFDWPTKDGYPLSFVGQIHCRDVDLVPSDDGDLLFFYDNRHWGDNRKDIGHAIVTHVPARAQRTTPALPTRTVPRLFGLMQSVVSPKCYQRVDVQFEQAASYPWYERKLLSFPDDVADECYVEFCCDISPDVQIGGFPLPIQFDFMERNCVAAFGIGDIDDWVLLLQLFELGDMIWGDAGALYWFIHQDDLRCMRFDRVWMVSQCH